MSNEEVREELKRWCEKAYELVERAEVTPTYEVLVEENYLYDDIRSLLHRALVERR